MRVHILHPSGETQTHFVRRHSYLGQKSFFQEQALHPGSSKWTLRDPTVVGLLEFLPHPDGKALQLRLTPTSTRLRCQDLTFDNVQLEHDTEFQWGETYLRMELSSQKEEFDPHFPRGSTPWLTSSTSGKELLIQTRRAAQTGFSIHLQGETGTGKEVLSKLVHLWSERKGGPFVPINCGSLPVSLAESELFGHVKGAYTGAHQNRVGALMKAHGGTLFLDEVADLSPEVQVKLLRFLESGEIQPVGSDQISHSAVRIITATHKPLQKLVEERKFREDLYYRLCTIELQIAPLRDRPTDVKLLSRKFSKQLGVSLSKETEELLLAYHWPGNVRELRHAIERAVGLKSPETSRLLTEDFKNIKDSLTKGPKTDRPKDWEEGPLLSLREIERIQLIKALKVSHGNRETAAKHLGVARSTIFEMIKRHRIVGPRKHLYSENEWPAQSNPSL